jgi:hypothetical protein
VAAGRRRAALLVLWLDRLLGDQQPLAVKAAALADTKGWRTPRDRVPLASPGPENHNGAFHQSAATALLGDCMRIAGAYTPAGLKPDVAARLDHLRAGADRYREEFLAYWSTELQASLKVEEKAWDDFAQAMASLTPDRFSEPLARTADQVIEACNGARDVLAPRAAQVEEILKWAGESKASLQYNQRIQSGSVLSNWKALGTTSGPAASQLRVDLEQRPDRFEQSYVICAGARAPGRTLDNFVEKYWEDLCYAGLRAIAERARVDAADAYNRVRASAKFPVVLDDPGGAMTLADMEKLRADLELAIGVKQPDAAPARVMVSCARFRDECTKLMDAGRLGEEQDAWLKRVRRVVDGLAAAQPQAWTIAHCIGQGCPDPPTPDGHLNYPFPYMAVTQGAGDPPGSGVRFRGESPEFGPFSMPATGPLAFHFFKDEGGGKQLRVDAAGRGEGRVPGALGGHPDARFTECRANRPDNVAGEARPGLRQEGADDVVDGAVAEGAAGVEGVAADLAEAVKTPRVSWIRARGADPPAAGGEDG